MPDLDPIARLWSMTVQSETGNLTHVLRPRATLRAAIEKSWTPKQRAQEAKFQSSTGNRAKHFVGLNGGQFYVQRERIRLHPQACVPWITISLKVSVFDCQQELLQDFFLCFIAEFLLETLWHSQRHGPTAAHWEL